MEWGGLFFVVGGAVVVVGGERVGIGHFRRASVLMGVELRSGFDVLEPFLDIHPLVGISAVGNFAPLVALAFLPVGVGSLEPPPDPGLYAADAPCCSDRAGDRVTDMSLDEFGAGTEAWGIRLRRRVSGQGAIYCGGEHWMSRGEEAEERFRLLGVILAAGCSVGFGG